MSKKLYEETNIQGIAAAIREKNGTQNTYTTAQMAEAIRAITTQPNLETLNATENGNYLPSSGKDGFSSVNVNVSGGEAVVQPLTATQNGTYNPPSGVDGYAPVTVNVSGGGGKNIIPIVTANSTYTSSPKQPYGAFGNVVGNFWGAAGRSAWLNINLQTPYALSKILLSNYYMVSSSTYWYSSSITVRASNDGFSTYTDLYTGTGLTQSDTQFEIDLSNSTPYIEYRFIVNDSTAYVGLGRIELVQESSGEAVIQPLTVAQNGIYTPPSGVDGFGPVTVNVGGGSSDRYLSYDWDFRESLIDSISGVQAECHSVTYDENGLLFNNASAYVKLPGYVKMFAAAKLKPIEIELDVGDMNLASTSYHKRFVMANEGCGLIYRNSGVWSFYAVDYWAQDSDISDKDYFSNSLLKIIIDSNDYWHIYKNNSLVYEPNRPLVFDLDPVRILGSSTFSCDGVRIKGLRIHAAQGS